MASESAFIAVVGRANVGKSSFVNRAVGEKIAIVSHKPQTTRGKIMGVLNRGERQVVFIDTPGFHKPKNALGESMQKAVESGLEDVDAALLVIEAVTRFRFDPKNLPPAECELISRLRDRKIPIILAINKIDLLKDKSELLPIIDAYSKKAEFSAVVPFSAKTGNGVEALTEETLKFCRPSPHYFSDDAVTDKSDEYRICEIIREKLLYALEGEVPHGVAVGLERFFEADDKSGRPILHVDAVIYCEKESHKGIIIGKDGALLRRVGTAARIDIEKFYGSHAALSLWVKVKENWRNRPNEIHRLGLD